MASAAAASSLLVHLIESKVRQMKIPDQEAPVLELLEFENSIIPNSTNYERAVDVLNDRFEMAKAISGALPSHRVMALNA